MMKNIKDITISIFAVMGLVAIITAFTNQPEQANQTTTPESHVWSFHLSDGTKSYAFAINKVTGEVRKYNSDLTFLSKNQSFESYRVTVPN